jgi:hypothetical protein
MHVTLMRESFVGRDNPPLFLANRKGPVTVLLLRRHDDDDVCTNIDQESAWDCCRA